MLPANESAERTELGGQRFERAAVALTPEQALGVGRHQLAVAAVRRAIAAEKQHRVIQRAAGPLVCAHDEVDLVFFCTRKEPREVRAGNRQRVITEQTIERGRGRMAPQAGTGSIVEPHRITGQPRLGKNDELRAVARGLGRQLASAGDTEFQVEKDRRVLHDGDGRFGGRARHQGHVARRLRGRQIFPRAGGFRARERRHGVVKVPAESVTYYMTL